ncbi:auxin efflux carrier component 5-like [Bidens hawaiensis]|uniref:auxin efflux carrier component 5-like n=1 Tax=Bidens hawaiensis TaxID=980011 RepID=UPI00404AA1BB
MIGWEDIYNLVSAMFPLYVALVLGYGSVKWWHMFKPDHCDAINRLNCYFIMPLFTFDFTSKINPYKMNHRFIAADAISKTIILITISLSANCSIKGSYQWSVTSFSLSSLNNSLIVGVPLLRAMYGSFGENLVIQSSILQSLLWNMFLLLMLEFEHAKQPLELEVVTNNSGVDMESNDIRDTSKRPSILIVMKTVGLKVAKNPNSYACILGLSWALIANRWNIKMPRIVEGSILIMSTAGAGVAMFCIGLFMALQKKIVHCSVKLTIVGMVLRFVAAPASLAVGSFSVGLRGDVLRVVVIQAALPQAISSFIYAKEYGLHVNVVSTAVIFGTIVSIPVLVAYYAVLDFLHG